MKITPMAPQSNNNQNSPQSSKAQDSRQRAIAALMGNQTPAVDQNSVQPEEASALKQHQLTPEVEVQETIEATSTEQPQETLAEAVATEDVKKTQEPQVNEEEEKANKRFIALAKQEKALRAREQALKAKEAELQAKESQKPQENQQDMSKYISKDLFKQDPLGTLAELGLSYEELTNQLLNPVQRDPRALAEIEALKNELKAIKQQTEESKKTYEEQQQQAYQAAVKQIESDVKHLVNKDPSFEAIKAAGAVKDVVELITETYHKDGILLTVEDAAQQVEEYLTEEYIKLTNIGKIKQRLEQSNASKVQAPVAQTTTTAKNPQQPQMKTLTNNTSASRPLSARERAILAMQGKLK